jgi:hypothetical protein
MNVCEKRNTSQLFAREDLSEHQRSQMFCLLNKHFDGVTREQFESDLAEKNWVILLHQEMELTGFSTLLAYESSFQGKPLSIIYSGDTIVSPEAWGTTSLSRAWISCVKSLRESYPQGQYYWLLLTSGFRTYRFLPVFWKDFFPRFDLTNDHYKKKLIDHLAFERFGAQYHPKEGLVRFTKPQKLNTKLREVPDGRGTDPHVAYFLERNSGFIHGDELVCLTELCDENLTKAGRRMIL